MRMFGRILTLIAFTACALPAAAQTSVTVTLPDQYKIGQAPPGMVGLTPQTPSPQVATQQAPVATSSVEHQQDTGLARIYTVVSPIFLGNDHGTTSYIRFFNGQNALAYTNVLVVGNKTGHVYGTANVTAPVYSSPQYSIQDILTAAGVTGFVTGDDGYALYLQDPQNKGNNGFQHVIYSNNNGFFENASMCTYFDNEQYAAINQILINVHTSVLSTYPAYIYIHNYYSTPVTYAVTITDARDGTVIGQVTLQQLAPNTSYSVPFTFFETALNWTPRANQQQANMIFTGNPGYYAIVGQLVFNQQIGSYVNLTHFCAINHYATTTN